MGLEDATPKLTPSEGAPLVKNAEGERMPLDSLVTAVSLECCCICLGLSAWYCFVLNQIMNRQLNKLVDTSRLQGLESWFWIQAQTCANWIVTRMLILPGCMDMRSLPIQLVQRVARGLWLHLQIALCYESQVTNQDSSFHDGSKDYFFVS